MYSASLEKMAIIVPTYNEAQNIVRLIDLVIEACRQFPVISFVLYFVDDNSPDNTALIAASIAECKKQENLTLRILLRQQKQGLGRAYRFAFEHVLQENYDYVMQMDADLSHHPRYISEFIKAAQGGGDMIIASRYSAGGGVANWGWGRVFLSRMGNFYSQLFLGRAIDDYTGGYNLYHTQLLRNLDFSTFQSMGYEFQIELKYRLAHYARKICHVAIEFEGRKYGYSKLPKDTIYKVLLGVLRIRFKQFI